MGSLADAKLREDHVEQVFHVDPAGDATQGPHGQAQLLGPELRGRRQRIAGQGLGAVSQGGAVAGSGQGRGPGRLKPPCRGMAEGRDEIVETMRDLRAVDCDLLTIGQYLRPSDIHAPVAKWYTPDEFEELRREGEALGFRHVASGPMVRSSYHADEQYEAAASAVAV